MQNEFGLRVEYAACRWARAVVVVAPLAEDVPTLPQWARAAHSSVGALRALCRAAHVSAKPSLDFARVLRAVLQGRQLEDWDPANLLDVRHERTLARLVRESGLRDAARQRRAPAVAEFLGSQAFVTVAANLRAVRFELEARRLDRLPGTLVVEALVPASQAGASVRQATDPPVAVSDTTTSPSTVVSSALLR